MSRTVGDDVLYRIAPTDQLIYDTSGNLVGIRNGLRAGTGADFRVETFSEASTATPTSSDTVVGVQGGVVKRFAKDSLGPFVNVKDPAYGATGDNVTDDTASIQAAIDAIEAAGGGRLYFPPGNYYHTGLTIPAGVPISILGGGYDSTVLRYHGSGTAIDLTGTGVSQVQKIQIEHISIFDSGGTGVYGLLLEYCVLSTFRHVRVSGFTVNVQIQNCWNDIFIDVTCDSGQDGFVLTTTDANAITFIGCQGAQNTRAGWQILGGRSIQLLGCTAEANGNYGVWLNGGATHRCLNVLIAGCYIEGNGTYEIFGDSDTAYNPYGVTIRDNYFCCLTGEASQAIRIVDGASFVIEGNTFDIGTATYGYSLYMASAGTKSDIQWGRNMDRSTNGVYSEIWYDNTPKLAAKAWVKFDGIGAATVTDSFGVTGVTRTATGRYTVELSQTFTNLAPVVTAERGDAHAVIAFGCRATDGDTVTVSCSTIAGVDVDARDVSLVVYGT